MKIGTAQWCGSLTRRGRGCARAACVFLLTIAIGGGFTTQQLFALLLAVPVANSNLVEENKNSAEEELQKHFSGNRCRLRAAAPAKSVPVITQNRPISQHRLAASQSAIFARLQSLPIPLRC